MRRRRPPRWLVASLCVLVTLMSPGWADERSRLSLQQTMEGASAAERFRDEQGAAIFDQPWLIAPSQAQPEFDGLGPLYNALSCAACHLHNGRGEVPDSGLPLRSALVRVSVRDAQGRWGAEPHYGLQLQGSAIPGVPAEARLSVRWVETSSIWLDGQKISLRRPLLQIQALGYGPLAHGTQTSLRMAPPLIAVGLLEAVPVSAVLAVAQQQWRERAGVHGQPNWVWDLAGRTMALGRFGWKANQPSVRQQTAMALHEDMGITSTLLPQANCMPGQHACLAAPNGGQPEIAEADLAALVAYQQALRAPAAAVVPAAQQGARLFAKIGCASCHQPSLPLTAQVAQRWGQGQIHPYTDLLLHDMGEGLADGRPDGLASGRQWRTTPLWGLGLARRIDPAARYLHDGRARSLLEAVLWHGGEAARSARRFRQLDAMQRAALLSFLSSL